jgi:uncharacterized protein YcbX
MEVAGLWRYPVKSLQGESLGRAEVEREGIRGDRQWGIRDEHTDRILTGRRRPELLGATASYDGATPLITLPDGSVLPGPGEETDRRLSEWLQSPVSLVPSASIRGRAEFFADATDDASEAIEFTMPAGRFVDAAPLLVLTTASLRAGAGLHPDGVWDPRRFRPNVLLDVDGDGWQEDGWLGRPLHVGRAVVVPSERCVRCTMVTRAQPGLAADVEVFRTLARHHGGHLGTWSDVVTPGTVHVGDPAVLDD